MTLLTAPSTLRHTPEDLLSMPENNSLELVNGRIVDKNVSIDSSDTEGEIYFQIRTFLKLNPVAKVFPATLGYTCFEDSRKMRKPDVSVISLLRFNQLADLDSGYMPIVPDLAVEVISPNDVTYDIDEKIEEYQQAGFPLIWIADPRARTIIVYPLNARPAIFTQDDEITAESALPGFRCKVRDFFPPAVPAKV